MSVARAGGRPRRHGRGKAATPGINVRGMAVAKDRGLTSACKKQFELVCEVKPDWTDDEIISFCQKCNFDANVIQQGLMNAFEDLLPSQDQNAEQWSVIGKKPRKKKEARGEERAVSKDYRERDRESRRGPRRDTDNDRSERQERHSYGTKPQEQAQAQAQAQAQGRSPLPQGEGKLGGVWAQMGQQQAPTASPEMEAEASAPGESFRQQPAAPMDKPTYATLLKRGLEKAAHDAISRQQTPQEGTMMVKSVTTIEETFAVSSSVAWASPAEFPSEQEDVVEEDVVVDEEKEVVEEVEEVVEEEEEVVVPNSSEVGEPELEATPSLQAHLGKSRRVQQLFSAAESVILPDNVAIESTMIQFGNFGVSPEQEPSYTESVVETHYAESASAFATNQQLLQLQISQMSTAEAPVEEVAESNPSFTSASASAPASASASPLIPAPVEPAMAIPPYEHEQMQQQFSQQNVVYHHQQQQFGAADPSVPHGHGPASTNQFGGYVPVHSLPANAPYTMTPPPHSYIPYDSEHQPHAYYDPYMQQQQQQLQQQQQQQGRHNQRGQTRGSSYRTSKSRNNRERGGRGYSERPAMKQSDKVVDGHPKDKFSGNPDAKQGRGKRHYQGGAPSRGYPLQHHAAYSQHGHAPMAASPMGYAPSSGLYSYPAPYVPPFYGQSQGYAPPPHGFGRHYGFQGASPNGSHYPNYPGRAYPTQSGYEADMALYSAAGHPAEEEECAAVADAGADDAQDGPAQPLPPQQAVAQDYEQWKMQQQQQQQAQDGNEAAFDRRGSSTGDYRASSPPTSYGYPSAVHFGQQHPQHPQQQQAPQQAPQQATQAFPAFAGPPQQAQQQQQAQQAQQQQDSAYGEPPARGYPHWTQ